MCEEASGPGWLLTLPIGGMDKYSRLDFGTLVTPSDHDEDDTSRLNDNYDRWVLKR